MKPIQRAKGLIKPLSLAFTDGQLCKSGLIPTSGHFECLDFNAFSRLVEMDCYHQHLTCLPHLERRQTIFHPQTPLLSSCHCYYSNSVGFWDQFVWAQGANWMQSSPKLTPPYAPFLVNTGPLPHTISRSSVSHHKAVEMVSVKRHNVCLQQFAKSAVLLHVPCKMARRTWISVTIHQKGATAILALQLKFFFFSWLISEAR